MRIDKLLANMGFGTRKEVKQSIKKGQVRVNGEVERQSKRKVDVDRDIVTFLGAPVEYKEFVYYMLHKPDGVISATEDYLHGTVLDLLEEEDRFFEPFPVGRLDKDTEGLLLLTTDGQLAHRLLKPENDVPKVYYAHIDGVVTEEDIAAFQKGVTLDDGYETKPGALTIIESSPESKIELTITEGKFHQVKRMFEAVDKTVVYLKRLSMGPLTLDEELPKGSYRELTEDEVTMLYEYVGLEK